MSFGRAAGKVILLGEHAVVYGRPALAATLDRGVRAELVPARGGAGRVYARGPDGSPIASEALDRALRALLEVAGARAPVDAYLSLDLVPRGGLGSSAAMGVAITRALAPRASDEITFACAMAWERVFHGSPSGIDVAASLAGGCIRFQHGAGARRVVLAQPLLLCVGHSGATAPTAAMVEELARERAAHQRRVEAIFDRIAAATDGAESALARGDLTTVGRLLDEGHDALASLGLSTPALDRMCDVARREGALGAKLTGAGGGGAAIALVEGRSAGTRVTSAWGRLGFPARLVRVARAPGGGCGFLEPSSVHAA